MELQPIISVVVATYNSATTVIETLESIKNQTYKNIELIITDDGSIDDTVQSVNAWISFNQLRFWDIVFIGYKENTGIAANLNRGVSKSTGKYIKILGADDILYKDCIQEAVEFFSDVGAQVLFVRVDTFCESTKMTLKQKYSEISNHEIFQLKSAHEQFRKLLTGFSLYAPGMFFSRALYSTVGGFDVQYPMMEDYPFLIKATERGNLLYFLNKPLVAYRKRNESIMKEFTKSKRFLVHQENLSRFEKDVILKFLSKEKMYYSMYELFLRRLNRRLVLNSHSINQYTTFIVNCFSLRAINYKIKYLKLKYFGK